MDFDDIVIGSGPCALATVMGLPQQRRVLVLAGERDGAVTYYPDAAQAPASASSAGGLGQLWHGVIPTGLQRDITGASDEEFQTLFARFYPHTDARPRLRAPWLFIPWRPLRPLRQWPGLQQQRGAQLHWHTLSAAHFQRHSVSADARAISVTTTAGTAFTGRRLWLAAGCLRTPALLERSLSPGLARDWVSDHAIIYLGQVDRNTSGPLTPPRVEHSRDGMWVDAHYSANGADLCSLRPARLAFRELDAGIAQRAVFGLPAGSAVRKLASGASLALISEALYTRLGLFPRADRYSVYAQVVAANAYRFDPASLRMESNREAIRRATDAARARCAWPGLRASQRPELFLPGIHLHHSLHVQRLADAGIDAPGSSVQVVDASAQPEIGPDHHTFKLMLAAWLRARRSG